MSDDLIPKFKANLEKVLQVIAEDMATVRTGRAKPDLVSGLEVMAYGNRMKLFELANITAPDPGMILIAPWDKSIVREIEKAIFESQSQLSPTVSGDIVRIVIPPLTEERRREFAKLLHQKAESGRVMVRQARQEIKEEIDAQKGMPGVSEDDIDRQLEQLQRATDEYMAKVEEMAKKKEAEVMAI